MSCRPHVHLLADRGEWSFSQISSELLSALMAFQAEITVKNLQLPNCLIMLGFSWHLEEKMQILVSLELQRPPGGGQLLFRYRGELVYIRVKPNLLSTDIELVYFHSSRFEACCLKISISFFVWLCFTTEFHLPNRRMHTSFLVCYYFLIPHGGLGE